MPPPDPVVSGRRPVHPHVRTRLSRKFFHGRAVTVHRRFVLADVEHRLATLAELPQGQLDRVRSLAEATAMVDALVRDLDEIDERARLAEETGAKSGRAAKAKGKPEAGTEKGADTRDPAASFDDIRHWAGRQITRGGDRVRARLWGEAPASVD